MQVEKAIRKMERLYREDKKGWTREYQRVEGADDNFLEDRLCDALRVIAAWSPPFLVLADVGKKRIVPDVGRRAQHNQVFADLENAPPSFRLTEPHPLIGTRTGKEWDQFPEETTREWSFFLDRTQRAVLLKIDAIVQENLEAGGDPQVIAVIGGPGTGKTCVLVRVLKDFSSLKGELDCDLRLTCSRKNRQYLESSGFKLDWCTSKSRSGRPQIMLLDDPGTLSGIEAEQDLAPSGSTIVCAF